MILKYEKINKNNIIVATKTQYLIFPESCAYYRYLEQLNSHTRLPIDYLVTYNDISIGVVGFYELSMYPDTIWVSYFGVLPEYRFKGFGKQIFHDLLDMAKKYNKKYLRLYTFEKWNSIAQPFYKKHMQSEEYYLNELDNQYFIKEGKPKIYGYSLCNEPITLWDNKYIDLSSEENIHVKSIELIKKYKLLD